MGRADETLKSFAHMAVAAHCSWSLRGRPPGELERPGKRGGSSDIVGFAPARHFQDTPGWGPCFKDPDALTMHATAADQRRRRDRQQE